MTRYGFSGKGHTRAEALTRLREAIARTTLVDLPPSEPKVTHTQQWSAGAYTHEWTASAAYDLDPKGAT